MNKRYNPKLLNTVVSGTGISHPRVPSVIVGNQLNGYVQGDLMDANAILELLQQSKGLTEDQLNAAIEKVVGLAPEELNTLEELAQALGNDPDFLTNLLERITEIQSQTENMATVEGDMLIIN